MPNLVNANIVPIPPVEYGKHPETDLEEDLSKFMLGMGIQRVGAETAMTEHQVFDALGYPQYAPIRSNKHVVYVDSETDRDLECGCCDEVSALHRKRFGYERNLEKAKRIMLVSHTTAIAVKHLMEELEEFFVISKTFRNKKERLEKSQIDLVLINRSLPELMAFLKALYSFLLQEQVELEATSDFYYFCEPSFSFLMSNGKNSKLPMGSGGFMRQELLDIITFRTGQKADTVSFLGLPYQKLLNMRLGKDPFDYSIDYNSVSHLHHE